MSKTTKSEDKRKTNTTSYNRRKRIYRGYKLDLLRTNFIVLQGMRLFYLLLYLLYFLPVRSLLIYECDQCVNIKYWDMFVYMHIVIFRQLIYECSNYHQCITIRKPLFLILIRPHTKILSSTLRTNHMTIVLQQSLYVNLWQIGRAVSLNYINK